MGIAAVGIVMGGIQIYFKAIEQDNDFKFHINVWS